MGPYLDKPVTQKHTVTGNGLKCLYVGTGMQGWRKTMEDSSIMNADLTDDCSVFGIFDGHGGREVALYVEKHFIEEFSKNINFKNGNISEALTDVFLRMDDMMRTNEGWNEVLSLRVSQIDDFSCAGCTANVAVIYKNTLFVANAGDSRAILCRNGLPLPLSQDHKTKLKSESDRITKAGGYISMGGRVNGNLNLTRALGDFEYKQDPNLKSNEQLIIAHPEIKKVELQQSDKFILMGCDGIWETLSEKQLIQFVDVKTQEDFISEKELKIIAEDMLDQIIAPDTQNGYGCDNMTACIILLKK